MFLFCFFLWGFFFFLIPHKSEIVRHLSFFIWLISLTVPSRLIHVVANGNIPLWFWVLFFCGWMIFHRVCVAGGIVIPRHSNIPPNWKLLDFIVAVPIYISTNSVQEFPFLHIGKKHQPKYYVWQSHPSEWGRNKAFEQQKLKEFITTGPALLETLNDFLKQKAMNAD